MLTIDYIPSYEPTSNNVGSSANKQKKVMTYQIKTIPRFYNYEGTSLQTKFLSILSTKHDGGAKFVKGWHYTLQEKERDGFAMPLSEFEYKGNLKEYSGIQLNSVIMKRVSGPDRQRFTLSKNDCEAIGIEYEPQLELFPLSLNWNRKKPFYKEFNPNDMSSLPLDSNTGLIHNIVVEFDGFERYEDDRTFYKFEDYLIPKEKLDNFLIAKNKRIVLYAIDSDKTVDGNEIYRPRAIWVDEMNNKLYIIYKVFSHYGFSMTAINPSAVDGMSASDAFDFYIDEDCAIKAQDYEKCARNTKFLIGQLNQSKDRIHPSIEEYDINTTEGIIEYADAMAEYYEILHDIVYPQQDNVQNPFITDKIIPQTADAIQWMNAMSKS